MCPAVPTTIDRASTVSAAPSASGARAGRARGFALPRLVLRPRLAAARPALPVAHALEDLDEPEVDLPHVHVHADDLHAHLVAQAVGLLRVLAAQHVRALEEPVVVVGHRRDVDEPLDVVLDELDEEAEGRHAGDVALELVADLVGHELHLLPLQQLALGLVGAPLHLGGVPRDLRQILGLLLALLGGERRVARGAQRAVDDEIGIAADRRGEMRVARRREAEVPEVLRRVARLLHRRAA